jgi:predicted short-subunit dehydrogenase-like oxidoreductase (DUF2520 family)
MNVVIIGTGNVATVLGKKLKNAGHRIAEVVGRNAATTETLAAGLNAAPITEISAISTDADLYLIVVPDSAIETVAKNLPLQGQTIVHTAASVSIEVLRTKTDDYGVLYPLQSLTKELQDLPAIPFLIDASNGPTLALLQKLAGTIGTQVQKANDSERIKMHLAAVMVNNFTNHLFTLAHDYCRREGLSFSLLQPLMAETVSRLTEISPAAAQTGPALRRDQQTIEKHLQLLKNYPHLGGLYDLLTKSIMESTAAAE